MLYYRATRDYIEQTSFILQGFECQCVAYAQWNKCEG